MTSQATTTVDVPVAATEEELRRIAEIFGVDPSSDEFRERLRIVAGAALEEFLLAFAGTRSPSTMREVRELRLQLLYKHLGEDAPTDAQVSQLFELTTTQTKNLIAGTRARYRVELERLLFSERAKKALSESTPVDEGVARVVLPGSVYVYLADLISETSVPPLEAVKGASSTYDINHSTAVELGRRLGFNADDLKGFKTPPK